MLSALFEGRSKVVDLGHPSQIGRVDESTGLWSWFGGRTRTGATVDETSAMRVTALFCAVKIISETVAQLPLTLLRDRGPAGRATARAAFAGESGTDGLRFPRARDRLGGASRQRVRRNRIRRRRPGRRVVAAAARPPPAPAERKQANPPW